MRLEELEQAAGRPVSRETFDRLEAYVRLLRAASAEQNLISASTLDAVWERHIADSAQLVRFAPASAASWLDIGSGAGLPGLVIAAMVDGDVTLVEPRRLRADFLVDAVQKLGLSQRVRVVHGKVENLSGTFDVITARAVAPLDKLLVIAVHLSNLESTWVLPKGRRTKSELAEARRSWHCDARSEVSRTDPQSQVLVLTKVRAKSTK